MEARSDTMVYSHVQRDQFLATHFLYVLTPLLAFFFCTEPQT